MSTPIKIKNGSRVAFGQLHTPAGSPSAPGYRQNGSNLARSDVGKSLPTPKIAHGMRRRNDGVKLSPHIHGIAVQDEPMTTKAALTAKTVPVHDGMGTSAKHAHQRGILGHVEDGSRHLAAASQLGRADRVDPNFDLTHVHHKISRNASLPNNKRRLDR